MVNPALDGSPESHRLPLNIFQQLVCQFYSEEKINY